MTAYTKGRTFEYRVKTYFEAEGYTVFRMAGSHSPADLICARSGEIIVIQCQIGRYFPPAKIEQLKELAEGNKWRALLAWTEKGKLKFKELTGQGGVNLCHMPFFKTELPIREENHTIDNKGSK